MFNYCFFSFLNSYTMQASISVVSVAIHKFYFRVISENLDPTPNPPVLWPLASYIHLPTWPLLWISQRQYKHNMYKTELIIFLSLAQFSSSPSQKIALYPLSCASQKFKIIFANRMVPESTFHECIKLSWKRISIWNKDSLRKAPWNNWQ